MVDQIKMEAIAEGGQIALWRRAALRMKSIPFSNWGSSKPLRPIVAKLGRMVSDGHASISADGMHIIVSHDRVAGFSSSLAEQVGMPPIVSASCEVAATGRIDQSDTKITLRWRDSNFTEVRPIRNGAFLKYNDRDWRLGEPAYRLLNSIDAFNETVGADPLERIGSWSDVQTALTQVTGQEVAADSYLSALTIYQAGSFALEIIETPTGPDFLPVLMAKSKLQADVDETTAPEGSTQDRSAYGERDEIADALLPPQLQNEFGPGRFASDSGVSPAYVLGRNMFVVLDPNLKSALEVVQQKRRSPEADRREFLRNPRTFISSILGQENDISGMFVETSQYSERVLGLGLWSPPALPWLARFKTAWMPEEIKLSVNGREVKVTEPLESLARRIETAKQSGEPMIDINGQPIQIDALEAVLSSQEVEKKGTEHIPDDDHEDETAKPGKDRNVLLITDNLEQSDYVAALNPRRAMSGDDREAGRLVKSVPKSHQVDGVAWLKSAWQTGWPGVLLADDMGLGKTFQALSFLAWIRADQKARGITRGPRNAPILVVAPTALLRTWIAEADLHLMPDVLGERVEAFGAGLRQLKTPMGPNWTPETALDVDRLRDAGWILVTYETLATFHRTFGRIGYSVAVFDEMQRIKSPTTINTHSAKTLSADFVLGLTGTPVENRLEDLWCIMDRVAPGYLGGLREFNMEFGDATTEQLESLKRRLDRPDGSAPAVLLRRMKEDILDGLPTKTIKTYKSVMPESQASAYEKAVAAAQSLGASRATMLQAIHRFRGISLHPELEPEIELGDRSAFEHWVSSSARVKLTIEILDQVKEQGEKALLFLESKAAQQVLAAGIALRYGLEEEPMIINGDVPGSERQPMVERFQAGRSGFDLMILSPRAAGIGLTITAANHVVHLSRWWNPAVEDQCNDRVYRIGQDKPVYIHIPMAIHPGYEEASFDMTLNSLLQRKRALSHHLLAPPEADSDIENLFQTVTAIS